MQTPARIISVEGIDSVGKSGHIRRLQTELAAHDVPVVFVSDPPRHEPWPALHETFQHGRQLSKAASATLLLAARVDNSQRVIEPALRAGSHVVADRYSDSWLAYQSVRLAPDFGGSPQNALDHLIGLQEGLMRNGLILPPDHTIYIADDPEAAAARSNALGKDSVYEVLPMQLAVAAQYDLLAEQYFPERTTRIDIDGRDEQTVYQDVRAAIYSRLDITP